MRVLKIGKQEVQVRATPMALLYYKQQFKTNLLGDLTKLEKMANDPSSLDDVAILQMVWAMARADAFAFGKPFPPFEEWISTLESVDFADPEFMKAVVEEAVDGFFRSGVKRAIKK